MLPYFFCFCNSVILCSNPILNAEDRWALFYSTQITVASNTEVGLPLQEGKYTSNFYCEVFSYHTVPSCQVSVDKLLRVQVSHAICNLSSHLDHFSESWWWAARIILEYPGFTMTFSTTTYCTCQLSKFQLLPFCAAFPKVTQNSYLCLWTQGPEIAFQIPMCHQLHYN